MPPPFVTCVCPTYGRPPLHLHLLEEAVYWFLRQEYPADRRELLVLNDCPGQVLVCAAPGVRVVNRPDRLPSLGEKYDEMVRLAAGDVILPWEDDDVSLPHRIAQAVGRLAGHDYWNPRQSWYEEGGRLRLDHAHGVCHNASAFTRRAWAAVGGYPAASGPQDAGMDARLTAAVGVNPAALSTPAEWSYVYRWSVSPYHLSGFSDTEAAYRRVPRAVPGRYTIAPRMGRDYAAEAGRLAVAARPTVTQS